jgi:hypothetical protein
VDIFPKRLPLSCWAWVVLLILFALIANALVIALGFLFGLSVLQAQVGMYQTRLYQQFLCSWFFVSNSICVFSRQI